MKFKNTDLNENIKRAVKEIGYEELTLIQQNTIEPILNHKDIIAMSNTGSGKTAAFMLPLINNIDITNKETQVLVITPTRELAIQIAQDTRKFCKYLHGINCIAIYGGQDIKMQAISLRKGVKIVIGTPGRILDLLKKKVLKLKKLKTLVLDEADEMLSMGFEEEINKIFSRINPECQKLLFSATMPEKIKNMVDLNLKKTLYIECKQNKSMLVDNIRQVAIEVKEAMKLETTLRLLNIIKAKNSIVFCNTKKKTEQVSQFLSQNNIRLEMLNSDIRQDIREKILKKLKQGMLDTIVVTDVLARGIDVKDLELVINYDIPFELEYYIHRIGRTARQGNKGVAYTFYTGKQINRIREIEEYTGRKFEYEDIPLSINDSESIDENIPKSKDGLYIITLSLGKEDSIKAKDIVGAMGALVGLSSSKIGKIEVSEKSSTIEIPPEYIKDVLKVFSSSKIKNKDVHIIK